MGPVVWSNASRCLSAAIVCALLAGCTFDADKITPEGIGAFGTALSNFQTLELALITEYQNEDRLLRYLSGGEYSCGDPRRPPKASERYIKNAPSYIEEKYKALSVSTKVVAEYKTLLKEIVDDNKGTRETITALQGAVTQLGKLAPGGPGYAVLSDPVGALLLQLTTSASAAAVQRLAINMQPKLSDAAKYLRDHFPNFEGQLQDTFEAWDSCVLERLYFTRDIPRGLVRGYEHKDYFGASSGVELTAAYQAYKAKRAEFRKIPEVRAALDALIRENDALAKDGLKTTAASVINAGNGVLSVVNKAREVTAN